jgi:hypothetical protein
VSAPTGVATTVYSIPSGVNGGFYVVAFLNSSGNPNNFTAAATVIFDGTDGRIVANNGGQMTLTLSGSDIQVTQTSGVTQTVTWKISQVV